VSGVSGSARHFTGMPNSASAATHPDLCTSSFSFSTWIKLDSLPSGWGIAYSNYGGDFMGWYTGVYQDGRVIFSVGGLPSSAPWVLSNTSLQAGRWHHLMLTFDGTTRRGRIFIDGVLDRTTTFSAWTPQTSIDPTFGRASWVGGYYLDCILDEAKLYTVELSP
jgi:hypothetical protein